MLDLVIEPHGLLCAGLGSAQESQPRARPGASSSPQSCGPGPYGPGPAGAHCGGQLDSKTRRRTVLGMAAEPSITAPALIEALLREGVIDDQTLVKLLGADRHDINLYRLERVLVSNSVVSEPRLLALKGVIAGLPLFDSSMEVDPSLPRQLANVTGALLLREDRPTVAMIEDLPANLERIGSYLGTSDFDVVLLTADQFFELWNYHYKGQEIDNRAPVSDMFELFDEAVRRRASDIHISVGKPPSLRVDGALVPVDRQPIDLDWMRTHLPRFAGEDVWESLQTSYDEDFAYGYGSSRFRVNLGWDSHGPTVAARKLPTEIPTPDQLGLPRAIRDFCNLERGLVLVTGPTGSGKSTTLACLLALIAQRDPRHIITLEDPIEFILPSGKAVVQQRELGTSFMSFPGALRQALRQDPDVILVGEMRDLETTSTAITAAETGHLVLGTLHTYDAPSTIDRIIGQFSSDEQDQVRAQLGYILRGTVSQTLLPLASGRGRVAAYEVMVTTPAIANNIRKLDGTKALRQAISLGSAQGMQTMDMALADLVKRNLVREVDAEVKTHDIEDFRRRVMM